jgi:hypothetical protein
MLLSVATVPSVVNEAPNSARRVTSTAGSTSTNPWLAPWAA